MQRIIYNITHAPVVTQSHTLIG